MDSRSGRGKNKRFWKKEEEETMLNCLMEISLDPRWKGEGGFKGGFTGQIEKMMKERDPGCDLLANPHIDSKVKWFREKYSVVNEMLSKTSGFQWDDEKKIVQCERQAYDDFCKTHPKASGLYNTPFPFLDKLEIIFGVDRATGVRCELPSDSVANMEKETINLGDDDGVMDETSMNDAKEEVHRPSKKQKTRIEKGKARMGSSMQSEEINSINRMSSDFAGFMNNISIQLGRMATTMNESHELERMAAEETRVAAQEARKKAEETEAKQLRLLGEIENIPGLTFAQAVRAAKLIAASPSDMNVFYSCATVEKKKGYVFELLQLDPS